MVKEFDPLKSPNFFHVKDIFRNIMTRYRTVPDVQQVCLNGHQITGSYNYDTTSRKSFCPICGEKTITKCPKCNSDIKGSEVTIDTGYDMIESITPKVVPIFCESCGKPFPWADKISTETASSVLTTKERSNNRKIFIVHGHNHGLLEKVERYLEPLGLKPVVLNKQADFGKTIIEKVEHYVAQTSFAIVILTKDDFGVSKTDFDIDIEIGSKLNDVDATNLIFNVLETGYDDIQVDELTPFFELVHLSKDMLRKIKPRARQNVIFELGITIGHLGRDRVRVLYEEGVELPTDIHGLAYTPLKSDWKKKLAQEINAAGIAIDAKFL